MIELPPSAKRIGLCSDIHSAYDHVLTMRNQRADVEHWFCAGDVVDMHEPLHYSQPTLRIMHRMGIPSVMGNHDYRVKEEQLHRLDDEARAYLSTLPFRLDILFAGQRIRITMPHPRAERISRLSGRARRRLLASSARRKPTSSSSATRTPPT